MFAFFFFNDTATTEIYTLSLHDALPICGNYADVASKLAPVRSRLEAALNEVEGIPQRPADRKSTRLNSSHSQISYAVFCLKKKKPARHPPLPRDRPPHGAAHVLQRPTHR